MHAQANSRLYLQRSWQPAWFVSACDEGEQGRVLRYEKGTYMGPVDQALKTPNSRRPYARAQGACKKANERALPEIRRLWKTNRRRS